jgi:penicillin-binding protein 2
VSSSIFEPGDALGPFVAPNNEFQVTIEPTGEIEELASEEGETEQRSFSWAVFSFAIILVVLSVQLINLQVSQGKAFQVLAQGNRIETKIIPAPRGAILDRKNHPLVTNTPIYNLELYPAQLPKKKEDRLEIYEKVGQIAGISAEAIVAEVDKHGLGSLEPLVLKANLPRETAQLWTISLDRLAGIAIAELPARAYEPLPGIGHLMGYLGKVNEKELQQRTDVKRSSIVGRSGMEQSYDEYLQGAEGREEIEVDSHGQIQRVVSNQPALPGNTLELYLDHELQQVMGDALAEGLKNAGRTKGVAIAIDPNTGGILGMVSLPSYDNNMFNQSDKKAERQAIFDDADQPLFNRALAGTYPPGSTFKPLLAAAGLADGTITPSLDIQTPAEIRIGESVFPDWKPHGHADVRKAIAESNNIFFYAIGGGYENIKGLGPVKIKDYVSRFGLGEVTGIDLPGERKGLIPDPDWKKKVKKEPWYTGDTYHMSIGQGDVLATPLQMVSAIAAIANNGTVYQPRLVKSIKDIDGKEIAHPGETVARKDIFNADVLQVVREGMRRTVQEGSARPLNDLPIEVAGKTGTAQFEDKDKTHAWFIGFAPYDKPTITLQVMVEGGGDSFAVAVPIAKKILSWYSEHSQ